MFISGGDDQFLIFGIAVGASLVVLVIIAIIVIIIIIIVIKKRFDQ